MRRNSTTFLLKISMFLLFVIIWACHPVLANQRLIEADGYYTVGDGLDENLSVAKERAKLQALQNASEKACIFVESVSEVHQGQLIQDEIRTISSNVLRVQGEPKYTTEIIGEDVVRFHCHVTAVVDDANVLDELQRDKKSLDEAVRRNKELEEEFARIRLENEALKAKYAAAVTETEKQELRVQAKKNDALFQAALCIKTGNQMESQKKHSQAIELYQKALSFYPQLDVAYENLGIVYLELNEHEKAVESFRQAIAINPQLAQAYMGLGEAYEYTGETRMAIENYQKALAINPQLHEIYNHLGSCYGRLDRFQESVDAFTEAIRWYPENFMVYVNRGLTYEAMHRYKEAKQDFAKAFALQPNHPVVAMAKFRSKDW